MFFAAAKILTHKSDLVKRSEKGLAEKCHLCYHRIDRGEKPACVDVCIGRCIYFGEIGELLSRFGDKRWKFGCDIEMILDKG
jgi:Fe-S-cluster-containing dehydrogenase component